MKVKKGKVSPVGLNLLLTSKVTFTFSYPWLVTLYYSVTYTNDAVSTQCSSAELTVIETISLDPFKKIVLARKTDCV